MKPPGEKGWIGLLSALGGAIVTFILVTWIPGQVKVGSIEEFRELNTRAGKIEVQNGRIELQLQGISDSIKEVGALKNEVAFLRGELSGYIKGSIKTSADVTGTVKHSISAPPQDLRDTLPYAGRVLTIAKEKQIRIQPKEIKEIGQELFTHHTKEKQVAPLAWNTLLELASYKSFIKGGEGYPEVTKKCQANEPLLLDSDTETANVTFDGCQVVYSSGPLYLTNVSFINCTFKVDDSSNGNIFLRTYLEAEKPTISLRLVAETQK